MNKWISVEDDLPEYNVPVLTWDKDYPKQITPMLLFDSGDGWVWAAMKYTWDLNDPECYECDDEYICTHWMNIPRPPLNRKR